MNREEIYSQFEELDKRASLGGGVDKIEKQHTMGKMTARERIELLLDKGTFNELDKFVNHRCTNFGMEKKQIPGDGMVTGYGKIDGRLVFVYAYDFTAHGGSLSETNAAKIVKVQELALKNGAPIIALNDSGGARIQEGVNSLEGYASIFYQNTIASGVIPQISAILGPCAGGACYSPALTDFIFMVKEQSHMFITGPDVVKTVTNEVVDKEELGGAYTHSSKSGVTHFMCNNEEETMMTIRELLSFLPSNNMEDAPFVPCTDDIHRQTEALQTVIPEDPNLPYDIKDIIEPVLDNQYFFEVMPHFAKNVVIGFGRLNGRSVGIVANQPAYLAGVLDIDASDKAARFIRFCDCFNIPIITFEDVPGFLPGTVQEHNGIIRHGAKIVYLPQGIRRREGRHYPGVRREVQQPLPCCRTRLHRRDYHAARHPLQTGAGPGDGAQQESEQSAEEAWQHAAVRQEIEGNIKRGADYANSTGLPPWKGRNPHFFLHICRKNTAKG